MSWNSIVVDEPTGMTPGSTVVVTSNTETAGTPVVGNDATVFDAGTRGIVGAVAGIDGEVDTGMVVVASVGNGVPASTGAEWATLFCPNAPTARLTATMAAAFRAFATLPTTTPGIRRALRFGGVDRGSGNVIDDPGRRKRPTRV